MIGNSQEQKIISKKGNINIFRVRDYDIRLSYGKGDGNLLMRENIDYFISKDLDGKK